MAALSLEDRLALHELLARYTHYLDFGQIEKMGEIWTEDCRFQVPVANIDIAGLANLQGFFQQTMAAVPNIRHVVSNIYVEESAEGATLHAYLATLDAAEHRVTMFARYRDECVKTPAGWRIRTRYCG